MFDSPLATAHRHLGAAVEELSAVLDGATEGLPRRLDQLAVTTVATLERRGTFAERGYRSPAAALTDLLGWERFEARRRVTAAEQVGRRTDEGRERLRREEHRTDPAAPVPDRLPALAGSARATTGRSPTTAARPRCCPACCAVTWWRSGSRAGTARMWIRR